MSIDELREKIDATDRELVRLLAERQRLSRDIGETKFGVGLPVTDAARERRVLDKVRALAADLGVDERDVERV